MQTQLNLPLFATDKDPDHRLVHDSGRSRVLRYPGGECWMHQSQADRAAAQMAAVLPYQQAPPRLEHFCRDNWRRRSSPRPGAPFPLWENHTEVFGLTAALLLSGSCILAMSFPRSCSATPSVTKSLANICVQWWSLVICRRFVRPTVPWKQKRSLTVRACV